MGYDLHITRRNDWSNDEEQSVDISLGEWLDHIDNDPDLKLSDAYRIKVPGSETESQVAPGFCDWTGHSSNKELWFDYSYGCISTKNPDDETIKKMLSISKALNAKVQGDDGEVYELTSGNKISQRHVSEDDDKDNDAIKSLKKMGWKFW